MKQLLIIFIRYPEPGKTKTRLIPLLGAEGAAALHRRMAEHSVGWAKRMERDEVSLEVRYEGGTEDLFRKWLGPGLSYREQGKGDLGRRMSRAFADGFQSGFERIALVGTDCPGLGETLVRKAFGGLESHEIVLGPALDGGYFLIGLRRQLDPIFENMPWGTSQVLRTTTQTAAALHLRVFLLEPLGDVDRPEDLKIWNHVVKDSPPRKGGTVDGRDGALISIVIPTLQEEENIPACLSSTEQARNVERIVVDGGSRDRTVEIAQALGATVLHSRKGRALQMNAGAEKASGEMLIFLHADTRLPLGFDRYVREALQQPGIAVGAFEFRLDAYSRGLKIIEKIANWRSRALQLPYGDQSLFLRAALFRQAGGFPELPIMEDVELVRRLRKKGRIQTLSYPAVTSARRWKELGLFRTTLINEAVLSAYYLGVSPRFILRLSGRDRRPGESLFGLDEPRIWEKKEPGPKRGFSP